MAINKTPLIVAIGGHVVSLNREDGTENWRAKLGTGSRSSSTVVIQDRGALFATSGGILYSLSPDTGQLRWENGMPKLGYGSASVAGHFDGYKTGDLTREELVFVGIKGSVAAMRSTSGAETWRTHLQGSDLVLVVREPDDVYASTRGEVFRLDAQSGDIRWNSGLPKLGRGTCIFASSAHGQSLAAKKLQDEQAAAAAGGAHS